MDRRKLTARWMLRAYASTVLRRAPRRALRARCSISPPPMPSIPSSNAARQILRTRRGCNLTRHDGLAHGRQRHTCQLQVLAAKRNADDRDEAEKRRSQVADPARPANTNQITLPTTPSAPAPMSVWRVSSLQLKSWPTVPKFAGSRTTRPAPSGVPTAVIEVRLPQSLKESSHRTGRSCRSSSFMATPTLDQLLAALRKLPPPSG